MKGDTILYLAGQQLVSKGSWKLHFDPWAGPPITEQCPSRATAGTTARPGQTAIAITEVDGALLSH